jgi:integrase/recombinase XerD
MKREALPDLSGVGEQVLASYEHTLRQEEDLAQASVRNYLSDLRHFAAWCEVRWQEGEEYEPPFTPAAVTPPTLPQYRTSLQHVLHLKSASVKHALISVKRYFARLLATGQITHDPAKVVNLVDEERAAPRQVNDQEEQALVAAVTNQGSLRDRAIIVLLLHTGLRARELCTLIRSNVRLGKRSGRLRVLGKGNKYHEIPLNATARAMLEAYDPSLRQPSQEAVPLFPSHKRQTPLTERGLGYLVKKYATSARLEDVSPHDLRHRFGYRMAAQIPLHRLAQLMGHDSLDTTLRYVQATQADLQCDVETIAWV